MPTKAKPTTSNASADDLRMLPIEEVALRLGMSTRTVERLSASGATDYEDISAPPWRPRRPSQAMDG